MPYFRASKLLFLQKWDTLWPTSPLPHPPLSPCQQPSYFLFLDSTYKWYHALLSFSVWLTSLKIMLSRLIHFCHKWQDFLFFLAGCYSIMHIYHTFSIYHWQTHRLFPYLGYREAHCSEHFWFLISSPSDKYIPKSGFAA